MTIREILAVAEFRAQLPSYLQLVASDRRARVYVGARRKAEAVVMSPDADVPPRIRQRLLSGFVARAADHVLRDSNDKVGAVVDDAAGDVFAWLWRTDPDQATLRMGDLMAEIHVHQPHANPDISFDDVLAAFRAAFPHDVTDSEYTEFVNACRAQVPGFYRDVNHPEKEDE
jgi:hypothetical protein